MRKPTPYHTFVPQVVVSATLSVVFAVASGSAFAFPRFGVLPGVWFAILAVGFSGLTIQSRRYMLYWAPIIEQDRRECEEENGQP